LEFQQNAYLKIYFDVLIAGRLFKEIEVEGMIKIYDLMNDKMQLS